MLSSLRFSRTLSALLLTVLATLLPFAAHAQTNRTLPAAADAYVQDGTSATKNFGTATGLYVKKSSTANTNRWSYIKFDLSSLPATVSSAKLRLYGKNGTAGYTGTDTVAGVTDTTWSETGITWNSKPMPSAAITSPTVTDTGKYVEWDVTPFVQAQQNGGATKVSLLVTMDAVTANADTFVSRENSLNTPQLVVVVPAPPAAPATLSATPGSNEVDLTWSASDSATSYNVKRGTAHGGPYTTVATGVTGLSYADTTVSNGTTYYYVVTASNDNGEGGPSPEASAKPFLQTTQPKNLKATADNSQVQLTWTGSSDANTYSVKRSTVKGGPYSTAATGLQVTSYRDTNVNNGTTYYYVVTATGANGESKPSNEAAATPTGTAVQGPTADSYVQDGSAGTNYGTAAYLYVKKNGSAGSNRTAYLKFALPTLSGAITSVKLRLYGKHQGTGYTGTDSVYSVADTTWKETGLTYSNRPALSSAALGKATITSTAKYYEWDVTAYVKAQAAAGATSVSLAVGMDTVPADGLNDQFYSKENSSPSTPQLVVTATPVVNVSINFQPSTSAVPSGYTADTGQPYNSARGFGWVREDSISSSGQHAPLDLSPNTRDRARSGISPLQNTIIHMQYPADTVKYPDPKTGPPIVRTPGAWDYDLPNGDYNVTVSVGDQPGKTSGYDSKHTVNVEGVNAINQFQATTSSEYKQATVTVTVTNGKLTVDAIGGLNTKLDYLTITNQGVAGTVKHPSVAAISPAAGSGQVYRDTAVKADLLLPNVGGIDQNTVKAGATGTIQLVRTSDGTSVPGNITIDGAGGAITYQPTVLLDPNTGYTFRVTAGLKDQSGATFVPFSASFTTGGATAIGTDPRVQFTRTVVYTGDGATSVTISPDNKLYAAMITGNILRWTINADGTLSNLETYTGLNGRALTGLVFDPSNPNVLWITSNAPLYPRPAPDFSGKIVKLTLTGPGFAGNLQDYIVGLPRSARDHLSESLAFGPDGKLYLSQGSDSAMGAPDNAWYNRPERLLNAAVLRIDPTVTTGLPIDVQTEDYDNTTGSYNPYAVGAPVQLFATGIRNAYDLVWHTNGNLYCPTNGSAAGGNTPASPTGITPAVPAVLNAPTQDDFLFKVVGGGYYGHPNPLRGNYVLNGGNPTAGVDPAEVVAVGKNAGYPVGTQPDANYRGYAVDLGRNRSPDGAIEYMSNTFGGALAHKLLTCEYSAGQDIVAVNFDANGNASADPNTGKTEIQVFGGLTNPLDLTEDRRNGSLYVSEFLGGGASGRISLLRPNVAAISASPTQLVYSGNQNAGQTAAQTVTISNIGSKPLTIPAGALSIAGTDAGQFVLTASPALPVTLASGQSVTVSAAFNPMSLGPKHAVLQVASNDTATAVLQIRLDGVGLDPGSNATSEPSLQYVLSTYGYPVNAGNPDPSKNSLPGSSTPVGDEVLIPRFQKAGPGAVTITPLAAFGPNADPSGICANFGWYQAGSPDSASPLFSIPNSSAKSMNPVINGTLSFDPGTSRFGLYAQWPFFSNSVYFQEDYLNTATDPTIQHHMRIYPLKNQSGATVPNTYIVTNEDARSNSGASNLDYNDLVVIVSNVTPAIGQIATENLDGLPSPTRFVFNRIGTLANPPTNYFHDQSTIRIRNIGLDPVNVTGLPISGPWILNGSVTLPTTLAANATLDVPVKFVAESGRVQTGSVNIQTSAPDQQSYPVTLAGYWQSVSENNQEPELNETINGLFGYATNTGVNNSQPKPMGGRLIALGDEVLSPYWKQAVSALPVQVQQIQAMHTYNPPNNYATIYWYNKPAGTVTNLDSLNVPVSKLFANNPYDSQSILPRLYGQTSGVSAGSFLPAAGAVFGFNIDDQVPVNGTTNPQKTGEWSDEALNYHQGDIANGATEPCGHHMRFWPLKDASGTVVPDTYIMSIDYAAVNYDFQDVVYVISNIKPENENLAAYVNPLIGTGQGAVVTGGTSSGATYPGPQVPFGMVALSPDTPASTVTGKRNGGGYDYGQSVIQGFSHTHMSGPGGPAYGDIPLLPTTGMVASTDPAVYGSAFSHSTETATPGYYRVNLDKYGVGAELTASTHVGWHRYTFPAGQQANVLLNVAGSLRGAAASSIQIVNNTTVEGSVSSYGYYNTSTGLNPHPYTVYFTAQFSSPFASYGTWNGTAITPGSASASGTDAGGYVTLGTPSVTASLVVKVGISFVSIQGARNNLAAEAGSTDFDSVRLAASANWNTLLHRVEIGGADGNQRTAFYTALYHSLLFPNTFSDADGTYIGFDNVVHNTGGRVQYANFSLWDTYRTEHPLLALVAPRQNVDMMASLMSVYREGGWLPRWPFANAETNDLMGDPALPVLADAYAKGQLGAENAEAVYQAMVHNATQTPAAGSQFQGRLGLDSYVTSGYVPYIPKNAAPQMLWGGSIGPEYALSDGALSLMASGLGHTSDAQTFATRAHGYRAQFDAALGLTHSRDSTGAFVSPFDTTTEKTFKEATAWQLTWMAPQDVNGLVSLLGGTAPAAAKLDQFFAYGRLVSNPQDVIRNTWGLGSYYNQYNEPDFHAPYLYAYLQQPWKTSTVVRAAETLYTNSPAGIPGNDDLGETSAWYVMSALGLYPTMPGANFYVVTSPLFKQAVVTLDPTYYSASTLTVQAPAASAGNAYIQSLSLNGTALNKAWINHSDIQAGANLVFGLGPKPSASWATGASAAPPAVLP